MRKRHEFGATNKPDTCLWCGKRLQHVTKTVEEWQTTPSGGRKLAIVGRVKAYDKPGHDGQGFFCTQTCQATFGDAFARLGHRLQPKE